jgi:hypothetical protein
MVDYLCRVEIPPTVQETSMTDGEYVVIGDLTRVETDEMTVVLYGYSRETIVDGFSLCSACLTTMGVGTEIDVAESDGSCYHADEDLCAKLRVDNADISDDQRGNAGCDACGMDDRSPESRYCITCAADMDEDEDEG